MQQIATLRRRDRNRFVAVSNEIAAHGCPALAYRLTGPTPLDHICVKHLTGALRVIVVFGQSDEACVVLLGPHDVGDPSVDVYTALYKLVGVRPTSNEKRTKPPCCGEAGEAPVLDGLVEELVERARRLRRTR